MRRLALLRVAALPFERLSSLRSARCAASVAELLDVEDDLAREAAVLEEELYRAAGAPGGADADPERARARIAILRLRRDVHNRRRPRPEDLEAARGAIDPGTVARLELHGRRLERHAALDRVCRGAAQAALEASRRALLALASEPGFEEGAYLASRSLLSRIRSLGATDPSRWTHDQRHVAAKIASYAARFCTKTSPSGVFCCTGIAEIGPGAARAEGEPGIARVDVLLNVAEARKVAECLAAEGSALAVVVPRPNPTLREADGGLTYWKPASLRNPTDEEVFSKARDHPVLRALLEEAGQKRLPAPELLEVVATRCGLDRDALAAFYRQVVERGILIAEVEMAYNSRRPLADLASAWGASTAPSAPWLPEVEGIEAAVEDLARLEPRERIASMERIGEALERLPHHRPLRRDELFRLDAATALEVGLPGHVLADLRAGLAPYVRIFSALYPTRASMGAYIARFLELHPADTDVPLLDLYRAFVERDELRRPLAFPEPSGEKAREAGRRLTDHLAERALRAGPGEEVRLDDAEVRSLVGDAPPPRWACGVLFQIAAAGPDDLDRGRHRLVLSGLFNGVGLALARFAHLHREGGAGEDGPILRELRRRWSLLERQGAIVAELSYNHIARTANAGLRPSIFRHEIELPGDKASPGAEVVPLHDLVVRYDSARDRIGLFWRPRGVEVLPVITSGVSPVGFVSFLVALGQQDLQYLGLFPGFAVEGVGRWPRIVSGRLVLFRERWIFGPGEWPAVEESPGRAPEEEHLLGTARWRRRHGLPRHVFVHTTLEPKPRYVDLESPVLVDLLRRSTAALERDGKGAGELHVTEMLPGPEELWIRDAAGRGHASEFLVQMQHPEEEDPGER